MPFTGEFVNETDSTNDERKHLLSVQSQDEELENVGDVIIKGPERKGWQLIQTNDFDLFVLK